eukprot:9883060-Lingulodinium_polyedra.AAC.1
MTGVKSVCAKSVEVDFDVEQQRRAFAIDGKDAMWFKGVMNQKCSGQFIFDSVEFKVPISGFSIQWRVR